MGQNQAVPGTDAPERGSDRTAWLRWAATRARGERPPFALCYHGIGAPGPHGDPHGLLVPRALVSEHLDLLARQGYRLVGISALWDALRRDPRATGVGALTFDDGLVETLEAAVELVEGRDAVVTAYVPTGLMGRPHPHLGDGQRIADPVQVRELADAGVEVGAHSVDHFDLRSLPYAEVLDQLRRSRATLEDVLGRPVTSMAYPFGSFSDETIEAAREAGYETACACSGPGRWRALALPREPVFPATSARRLRLKVAGLYGPVHTLSEARHRFRRG